MSDLGGLNPHHAVAGLGGGLASLPILKPVGKFAVIGSVVAGVTTAMYLTPLAAEGLLAFKVVSTPLSTKAELGLAFLLGLTAMVLIPAILGAATWLRDNVVKIMERVTGGQKGGE